MSLSKVLPVLWALTATSQAIAASPANTTRYTYNPQGQVGRIDGPSSASFSYDEKGNLTSLTHPDGDAYTYSNFNADGLPEIIRNGPASWKLSYSVEGKVTQVRSQSTGLINQMAYNATGDLIKRFDPTGSSLEYIYDDARRLTGLVNGLGEKVVFKRDVASNITDTTFVNSKGASVASYRSRFDEKNQLIAQENTPNTFDTLEYDAAGHIKKRTRPLDRATRFDVDALGRHTRITDPGGGVTEITYDAQGNVASVTDARGVRTLYSSDHQDRATQIDSPDAGTKQRVYDALGNLVQTLNGKGEVVKFSHDAQGRVISKRFSARPSEDLQYTYQPGVVTITGAVTKERYQAYDNQRLKLQSYTFNTPDAKQTTVATQFNYDVAGRPNGWSNAAGVVSYTRDKAGQIASIDYRYNNQIYAVAKRITHLPFGPVSEIVWGNDSTTKRHYDNKYRLVGVSAEKTTLGFAYDAAGNLSSRKLPGVTQSYTYGQNGHLLTEKHATTLTTYTYDRSGNRTQRRTVNTQTGALISEQNLSYAASSNRIASRNGVALPSDANGNLIGADNGRVYVYDAENRLQEVRDPQNRLTASYLYNAQGQRSVAYRYTNGATTPYLATHYTYDPQGKLIGREEFNQNNYLRKATWIWVDQLPVAQVLVEGFNAQAPRVSVLYLQPDQLNTPRVATDRLNNVAWHWPSDGYGTTPPVELPSADSAAPTSMPLRFAGQFDDVEAALVYNYHRDYSPDLGRYLQSDPIGVAGGLNTFLYVSGNPTNLIDPFGLAEWSGSVSIGGTAALGWGGTGGGSDISACASLSPSGVKISLQVTKLTQVYGSFVGWGISSGLGYGDELPKGADVSHSSSRYVGAQIAYRMGAGIAVNQSDSGISASGGGAKAIPTGMGAMYGTGTTHSADASYGW